MAPPVVWFVAVFVGGTAAGQAAVPPVVLVPLALLALRYGGPLATRAGRWVPLGVLAAGWTAGWTVEWAAAAQCAARWSPGVHAAIVRIHDRAGEAGATSATVEWTPTGCAGVIRIRGGELMAAVPAGSRVVLVGRVATPRADFPLIMVVQHLRVLDRRAPLRYRIRDTVRRRIERLYGARGGVVQAMVLGSRADLDRELRGRFVQSGLAHLLAISGLHVGMLAGWVALALRLVVSPPRAMLGSALLCWPYVALLGFPAPATRAAAFVTVAGLARRRERNPSRAARLAVGVLVVVAVDPGAVTAVGAWLSVAAVWGTGHALELAEQNGRAGRVTRLLAASIGATVATSPITAWAFGSVAPIGIVANLAAVPLAALAVPGIFASLAVGEAMATGAGLALAGIELVAEVGSGVPYGHLEGEPGPGFAWPWVVGCAVALWLAQVRDRPVAVARRLRIALTGGLMVFCAWPVLASRRAGPGLVVHVLDVGQGDAIAIRTPGGRWVLVDAGPAGPGWDAGTRVVLPFLRRRGAERLAAVIVSHGDMDHVGGAESVVDALDPEIVIEPGQPLPSGPYRRLLDVVAAREMRWAAGRAGDTLVVDSVIFAVVHPSSAFAAGRLDQNENSIVIHLRYGAFDMLLTGDTGFPAESAFVDRVPRVDVLKVGHHGSAGSTGALLLDRLAPDAAIVSVGRRNRYGHPASRVLAALRDRGIPIYRTDRAGAVTVRTDGRYYQIRQGNDSRVLERLRCLFQTLSPSNDSFSSKNGASPRPPGNSPTCSTTSLSPPRSFPAKSAGPA